MARWLTVTAAWVAMLMLLFGTPQTAFAGTPTVNALLPPNGPQAGGAGVTIFGNNFEAGATVLFGGVSATSVEVLTNTQLIATTPCGTPGSVSVVVRNPGGEVSTGTSTYLYETPVQMTVCPGATPTVTSTATSTTTATPTATASVTATPSTSTGSVTPNGGPASGGTTVRITGSGFIGGSTVSFGANAATSVVVLPNEITVVTPPGTIGTVDVLVRAPGGAITGFSNAFTYTASATLVTSVAPTSGPTSGGTIVTITGNGFLSGVTVSFGGVFSPSVTVVSPSQIQATVPPGAAGTIPVLVANPGGTVTGVTSGFTYITTPLTVAAITPASGPLAGGTQVTITGTGFQAGATVSFGSSLASGVAVIGPTQISATTPAGAAGPVTVTVGNPGGGNASMASGFTYSATAPIKLPVQGFGLFVFSGGSNDDLVRASGCSASTAAFWATDSAGGFVVYVPGTNIAAVNAAWNAKFSGTIPASTPLIGRCA